MPFVCIGIQGTWLKCCTSTFLNICHPFGNNRLETSLFDRSTALEAVHEPTLFYYHTTLSLDSQARPPRANQWRCAAHRGPTVWDFRCFSASGGSEPVVFTWEPLKHGACRPMWQRAHQCPCNKEYNKYPDYAEEQALFRRICVQCVNHTLLTRAPGTESHHCIYRLLALNSIWQNRNM